MRRGVGDTVTGALVHRVRLALVVDHQQVLRVLVVGPEHAAGHEQREGAGVARHRQFLHDGVRALVDP